MIKGKPVANVILLAILASGMAATINATYYKPDFFPIGLTGLNYTGSGTPYGEQGWTWDDPETNNEKALIFSLGVNCIVFEEDGFLGYMGSLDTSECRNQNNYLYRVCIPSFTDDDDSTNPEHICIIVLEEIPDSLILTNVTDSLDF